MSHVVRVEEDKETTREQWVLDLDTYLAECKAERETTAVEDFDAGTGTLVDAQSYRCRRDGDGGFVMEPCDGSADPNKWDDAGTLREMPPGKWQSLLVFKSGQSTRWVYGQRVFDSADAVKAAVEAKDLPTYDPGLSGWFGIWAVRQGATDLTDNTQAVFLGPDESDPTHTLFLQRTM